MAKKVLTQIKLQISAGSANPAPPVGPALGQHGVNIMDFCKAFNAQTQGEGGETENPRQRLDLRPRDAGRARFRASRKVIKAEKS